MTLIHGRGQLGTALQGEETGEWIIYHTWEPWRQDSEKAQQRCFEQFRRFCHQHAFDKICFISTKTGTNPTYLKYKMLAEAFLTANVEHHKIVLLPNIIGKGICQRFRDGEATPYGTMEIITATNAAKEIITFLDSPAQRLCVKGSFVPAHLVKALIRFGRRSEAI